MRSWWNVLRLLNILPDEEDGERIAEKERERRRAEERLRRARLKREAELRAARKALAAHDASEITLDEFMEMVTRRGGADGKRND
jgi:hypothetical protein